uniref:Uncharacterized protein n=1 Tax=Rhizophora mucronata TaxID=61149 RepID=A0A2P2QJ87_RHIMU
MLPKPDSRVLFSFDKTNINKYTATYMESE